LQGKKVICAVLDGLFERTGQILILPDWWY
jgi:hypothetical protein